MPIEQVILPQGDKTNNQYLRDLLETPLNYNAEPTNVVTAAGIALDYDRRKRYLIRSLQNIGDVAVMWNIDQDNNPEEESCHGILAAGTAVNDGLGGQVDLSRVRGKVRVKGVAGGAIRVAAFQVSTP